MPPYDASRRLGSDFLGPMATRVYLQVAFHSSSTLWFRQHIIFNQAWIS